MSNIGRNSPCPCGSGKKYKKCCAQSSDAIVKPNLNEIRLRDHALQLHRAGQINAAIENYEQYLQKQPNDGDVWFELGKLNYSLNPMPSSELKKSIICLRRALAILPNDEEIHNLLITALVKNFNMDEVIKETGRAIKKYPNNYNLLFQRGFAQVYLNQFEKGRTSLEAAKRQSPNNSGIIASLSKAYRRLGLVEQARELMLEHLKTNPLAHEKTPIWYEYGHLCREEKEYEKAFSACAEAGKAQLNAPELKGWSPNRCLEIIDENKQWMNQGTTNPPIELSPERDPNASAFELIFFIGFPRSGTTLTEQILASHSEISTSEEKPHLGFAIDQLYRKYGKNYREDSTSMLEKCSQDDLKDFRENYWSDVRACHKLSTKVFIDKLPLNLLFINWIHLAFPDAKIVMAIRDPRDVCLSCFFQYFTPNTAMNHFLSWETTQVYYDGTLSLWEHAKRSLILNYYEIKYEKTVTNLEQEIKGLVKFIGLNWEKSMMEYRSNLKSTSIATPSNEAVQQPIYKTSIANWQNYSGSLEKIYDPLNLTISKYGYEPHSM